MVMDRKGSIEKAWCRRSEEGNRNTGMEWFSQKIDSFHKIQLTETMDDTMNNIMMPSIGCLN